MAEISGIRDPITGFQGVQGGNPPQDAPVKGTPPPSQEDIDKALGNLSGRYSGSQMSMLNQVLELLMDIVPVMQRLAIAQSGVMELSTKMQGYYTKMLANAPVYTEKDEKDSAKRSEKNRQVELQMEKYRAWRDADADEGKKAQANVNSVNDAINQQMMPQFDAFLDSLRQSSTLIFK